MKKLDIFILVLAFFLFFYALKQNKETRIIKQQNKVLNDSLKLLKSQKKQLQIQFKEHLSECSFISKQNIKSWKGVYVILYQPVQTERKLIQRYEK